MPAASAFLTRLQATVFTNIQALARGYACSAGCGCRSSTPDRGACRRSGVFLCGRWLGRKRHFHRCRHAAGTRAGRKLNHRVGRGGPPRPPVWPGIGWRTRSARPGPCSSLLGADHLHRHAHGRHRPCGDADRCDFHRRRRLDADAGRPAQPGLTLSYGGQNNRSAVAGILAERTNSHGPGLIIASEAIDEAMAVGMGFWPPSGLRASTEQVARAT
jgi:hypothetical protein